MLTPVLIAGGIGSQLWPLSRQLNSKRFLELCGVQPCCNKHWPVYSGVYDSIESVGRYQIKRVTVKPGLKFSLQMHHHRAEHREVVSGIDKKTNEDKVFLSTEIESTYIQIVEINALENLGKISLELVEVQSGSYLGQNDAVMLKDNYGRV